MDAALASRRPLHSGIDLARFVKAPRAVEHVQHLAPGRSRTLSGLTVVGAVVSGFLASVCCIGLLVLAMLGIGGAGLLARFEVYRPIFTAATLAPLRAGVWLPYLKHPCGQGVRGWCALPAR